MTTTEKKDKILKLLVKYMNMLDPSGSNATRYEKMISGMSEIQFRKFMENIKEGKFQIHVIMPNMKNDIKMENILKTAKATKTKLFHKLKFTDPTTGRQFTTNEEYPVFNVPVRRQQQYLDKKLSVPDSDKTIDGLTGQVTAGDQASSMTPPEIQVLYVRGLETTLNEMLRVRGGDIHAYGEFKRQLEESGAGELSRISPTSKTRSSAMMEVLFKGMGIDINI